MGKIKKLDNLVAQRIAAGEVIERPSSVIRELVDNSLDSNADEIIIYIEGGGIDKIKVIDNGSGISREDLPLAITCHATSKISSLDDLYHLNSMGFRGEALYSIASVSRLSIASKVDGEKGAVIEVDNSDNGIVKPFSIDKGTQVTVEDLFFHLPARKNFLKRPTTEAKLCKATVIQKALSHPHFNFKFYSDGALKLDLVKRDTLAQRVLDILAIENNFSKNDFITAKIEETDYSIELIASKPSLYRSDRSGIKIYLNNRQIEEFSLVQAVTYGYGELLPGGSFAYAYVFISDNPELVDFNIHPAKREAKIRNLAAIHHSISTLVKSSIPRVFNTFVSDNFHQPDLTVLDKEPQIKYENESKKVFNQSFPQMAERPSFSLSNSKTRPAPAWLDKAKELLNHNIKPVEDVNIWEADKKEFVYIGQAFNLFLIAQKEDKLYLVDQHAAHERIIYDELKELKDIQKLLVPIEFEVDMDVDHFLSQNSSLYSAFGIEIEKIEDKLWTLTALPALMRPVEKQIIDFIQTRVGDMEELESGLYAITACKAAIKAGDRVDNYTANAILEKVFQMKNPCCPHGRTFISILTEEELRKMVGRTN